jgi:phosphatidylinositol dimannoside acyltransferase
MPGGPALLAAQTGAALLPAICQFDGAGWRFVVHPEVPVDGPGRLRERVTAAMQQVADAFATTIAERPEDWHVLGRIWPEVGPEGTAPRTSGAAAAEPAEAS